MSYLTEEEYKDITNKDTPENFKYIESLAENIINIHTFYRIENIEDLSIFRKTNIKKAMTYLINALNENDTLLNSSLKSVNLNGIQMQVDTEFENNYMYRKALELLFCTGLCYSGW